MAVVVAQCHHPVARKAARNIVCLGALILTWPAFGQSELEITGDSLDAEAAANALREQANPGSRELTVLSPTIAPEELDRVVLNRLLQEIAADPQTVMTQLAVNEDQLEDIRISLANAAGFINNNEMANVRAMCSAWNNSRLTGDARIQQALDAYKARRQFTRDFIARFYRVLLLEIETMLSEPSQMRLQDYLDDRRRRLANAGNVISAAIVENISNGSETVQFHCRR